MTSSSSLRCTRSAAILTVLLTTACAPEGAQTEAPVVATPSIEAARSLGVVNARMPIASLLTAGQLTQEQFDGLAASGFKNFISLRLPEEAGAGWEEDHAPTVSATFTRVPVAGGAGLNRENVEELARLLEAAGAEGTVLYCASSNRVGALLALKAAWIDGVAPEEALQLGRAAGMTRLESNVPELLDGS
jgi:protein tyrosine phosphatase (PTP) superfamily phosphohydrolase (DUF442 family)